MACKDSESVIKSYALIFIIIFPLFMSCQTAPKVQNVPAQTLPLEGGASVYIIASVKNARSIIELLPVEELNGRQARQMIDKTDTVAAAVFPQTKMQLAASGKYPSLAGLAFIFNKNWKKQRTESGGSYWYSKVNGLSLSMNSKQAFIISSADKSPVEPVTGGGAAMPEGFYEFSRGYPFSCWLEDPAPMLAGILDKAGVPVRFPVQQVFINLYPVNPQNQYEALIRLQFENALQSRGMAAVFNLASGLTSDSNSMPASLLFANPPVQNGRDLDIRTKRLTEGDITLLLETFLLY